MIKIANWNVNSLRTRHDHVVNFLKKEQPDILLMQELKCLENQAPSEEFENLGYNFAMVGQKSYNAVGILSKFPLEDVQTSFPNCPDPEQARFIEATISLPNNDAVKIVSVYVPNGGEIDGPKFPYKMEFLEQFTKYAAGELSNNMKTIIGGDFNIAPTEIDVYDPKLIDESLCCSQRERAHFHKMLGLGYFDAFRTLNPKKQEFSWWDYRAGCWQQNKGMRIDHFLLSPEAMDTAISCSHDLNFRGLEKPSDHAAVILELE